MRPVASLGHTQLVVPSESTMQVPMPLQLSSHTGVSQAGPAKPLPRHSHTPGVGQNPNTHAVSQVALLLELKLPHLGASGSEVLVE